jgi:hypothetical protein
MPLSTVQEDAPLLISSEDCKLGREARSARGRTVLAVGLTLLAVGGCVCVSVAGALHGPVGLSRLGWEVTEDFMKESEKLYDQMDDAGVTKLEVTAATTAAPEPPAEDDGSANNQGGQQGIQQGDLQGDQQVNRQGGQQGEEGQQGQKEQYSQQWQQGPQWQQERQWQRTPEQVPQDGTWVNMAAPVQVGQTSQPRERLTTPNAKTTKTIHFNPCQDAESQKMQWTKGALADQCEVDAAKCEFCAWVLQYDSEYRVNDVVSLQGLNYKLTSQSLLTRPEYQGTILRRMLESKPKHPNSNEIMWHENDREEAQENFEFILDSVKNMDCGATGSDTLLVHLRAGDSVGTAFKEIPDTDAAARKVVEYAKRRPGIKRIEISGVLHFGVPDPDDAFYAANGGYNIVKDASGLPAYRLTDDNLQKNGYILNRFFKEAKASGMEVWFTSSNNPDTDMCRYAKACHYVSADRIGADASISAALGSAYTRHSFSDLLDDLHWNLRQCNE